MYVMLCIDIKFLPAFPLWSKDPHLNFCKVAPPGAGTFQGGK